MLIRVRSPEGQHRVEVQPSDTLSTLTQKIAEILKTTPDSVVVAGDPTGRSLLPQGPLSSIPLKHGDQVFVAVRKDSAAPETTAQNATSAPVSHHLVKQDPIDDQLLKQPGTIKRGRNPQLCKHGDSGMCEYCMPLQPYDAKYQEENKIKHLSFHAYLRQVTDQNKTPAVTNPQFLPPLEDPDFKVKVPCPSGHAPFPKAICSKCQPSSVTLQQQTFRMTDHVEFEVPELMENFINFWRQTGLQRFGYLYGRFEPYSEVPLGIKAVVCAIYEPPQDNMVDGVQLQLPDPREQEVDGIAKALGLTKVGMIYTDLTDDGTGQGTVICKRHADSYFLSSAECIFAAQKQDVHLTASKYSPTGHFGSRFVTVVVTGNEENGIEPFSYQVSNFAMAMVRDGIVEASVEPSLMRVKESTNERYVPEVFYKYKNEYGLMVKEAAKPTFPVEYLLVTLSHGFPNNRNPTFLMDKEGFPIENRPALQPQDMGTLYTQLFKGKGLSYPLSDFHLLLYLWSLGQVVLDDFNLALEAVRTRDERYTQELAQRPSWQTLRVILEEASRHGVGGFGGGAVGGSSGAGGAGSSAGRGGPVKCRHCTFDNPPGTTTCEVCGLPPNE
ncbi:nuclear protein localization protein 4 [Rhizophlyctis rosea]|nr:nuclear protein localization protein 4 [Rhizophlyctis rosea]